MVSSRLKNESRVGLWFGKYEYRATLILPGISRTHGARTYNRFLKNLLIYGSSKSIEIASDIKAIDLSSMERFYAWKTKKYKPKTSMMRLENNRISVFSNDLPFLQTLESIPLVPDDVTYIRAVLDIPTGTKYFKKEPKHKFRVYLKGCTLDNQSTFRPDLIEFIRRYRGTSTVIIPSGALERWLIFARIWSEKYCMPYYYLEYDDPGIHSLIHIMFSNMIGSSFKLEKHP
jgi:hypothetical protein